MTERPQDVDNLRGCIIGDLTDDLAFHRRDSAEKLVDEFETAICERIAKALRGSSTIWSSDWIERYDAARIALRGGA